MIRNIKAEQELKMTLKPIIRTHQNTQQSARKTKYIDSEGQYSTVDQKLLMKNRNFSSTQSTKDVQTKTAQRNLSKNSMTYEEQQQLEKMEKARQNMLKKIQQQEQGITKISRFTSFMVVNGIRKIPSGQFSQLKSPKSNSPR